MDEELKAQLEKDFSRNLPILGFFSNYPLKKKFSNNESFILQGKSDYDWAYLSVTEPDDLRVLLEKYDFSTLYFANVEDWMIPQLCQNHRIEWKLTTHRFFLPASAAFETPGNTCIPLDASYVNYIYRHSPYKDFTSENYIIERLEKDISAGIWLNEDLIGWGLTHDDGSLGFLNVVNAHRGKGVGEAVLRCLIHAKRRHDKPVYVNVEPHNKESLSLLKKMGFEFERVVSWVKLI